MNEEKEHVKPHDDDRKLSTMYKFSLVIPGALLLYGLYILISGVLTIVHGH